jgi:hypothetical protein
LKIQFAKKIRGEGRGEDAMKKITLSRGKEEGRSGTGHGWTPAGEQGGSH